MDSMQVLYAFAMLLLVVGGIWTVSILLRLYGERLGFAAPLGRAKDAEKRLKLQDQLMLDAKHKLVVISDQEREYVLLLGPNGDVVVSSHEKGAGDA